MGWTINLALDAAQATLATVVTNLWMVVPSSPGYVGVYEASVGLALNQFYSGKEALVLSYALLTHAAGLIPALLAGMLLSWREGISLAQMRSQRLDGDPKNEKLKELV